MTADASGRLQAHSDVTRNVVREAILAEAVGVDFFGVGEHHRADYAVSAPEVVLAAIAGQTKQIRLGSAATVLGSEDPIRVFQRFATLNALSSGRAEVILGRGWFTESFRLFGYNLSQYDAIFDEKLTLFAALLNQSPVSWRGKFRPPLEKQHIYPAVEEGGLRTWVAVGASAHSVLRAAQHDFCLMLAVIGGEPKRFAPFVELYRTAFDKLGRPAKDVGIHSSGYIADTDKEAAEEFWPAYKQARDALGSERGWPPISRGQFDAEVARGSLYVGSPDTVAHRIAETVRALGATRFQMKYSAGKLSHEKMLRSIELYGRQVIPRVRQMLA